MLSSPSLRNSKEASAMEGQWGGSKAGEEVSVGTKHKIK